MTYWVYEDDPTNRVRVHKVTCGYCNDGKGIKGSRSSRQSVVRPLCNRTGSH